MGMLDRIRSALTGDDAPSSPGGPPAGSAPLVEDWPSAAERPTVVPDPDDGFDADTAPLGTVGVLQWTPGVLVDGGAGEGFWDYWDLDAWSAGSAPLGLTGDLGRDATREELHRCVADVVGRDVELTPSSFAFSGERTGWRTAPLFVVTSA